MVKQVQAVCFDIGGVLTGDAWEPMFLDEPGNLADRYSLNREEVRSFVHGLFCEFARDRVAESYPANAGVLEREFWQRAKQGLGLPLSVDALIRMSASFVRPVLGMRELLRELRVNGIQLAICSNAAEFTFKKQSECLRLDFFIPPQNVILSCRLGVFKDSQGGEMFQAVLSALGLLAEECIFVDDRAENVERALRFGMTGILFPRAAWFGADYLRKIFTGMYLLDRGREGE
ncbi:MAG: HAD family phosphatase [Parcubacteria group bacterium]|nr:HAD family phosphatase [Parcubacteria group bacterium]